MKGIIQTEEAQFLRRLKFKNARLPFVALFEITSCCNLNCIHCVHPANVRKSKSELKLDEIYNILNQLQEIGCIWLNISGGEPFLRNDFMEIYEYAIKEGFLIRIFTNGTLINKEHIKVLKEYPPFVLRISLYGATEEMYYKITQAKNIFKKLMNNLLLLKKNGINFRLHAQINKENINEAKRMKRIAEDLGVDFSFSSDFAPRSDGDCFPSELTLSSTIRKELREVLSVPEVPVLIGDSYKNCRTNRDCIIIDYQGTLILCPFGLLRRKGYSLLRYNLKDVWEDIKNIKLPQKCPYELW